MDGRCQRREEPVVWAAPGLPHPASPLSAKEAGLPHLSTHGQIPDPETWLPINTC